MEKEKGSVFGAILLIAGCAIGAGMLGLPVLSAQAGFLPTCVLFFVCWLFMASTGLLLQEVNLWYQDEVSIISMVGRTLGKWGQSISWLLYLFLFYSLMVAYVAASGSLLSSFFQNGFLSSWDADLISVLLFGIWIYFGTRVVDFVNRLLMIGLIVSYFSLVILGSNHIQPELLLHRNWSASLLVIPAMIISFGYHNLIPSLTTYLGGNASRLYKSILIGSAIPLIVYLIWEVVILGIIPVEGFQATLVQGETVTHALQASVGSTWISTLAHHFAFYAIVTSFLSVALSFLDFLADGLHIQKTATGKALLCFLVLAPPFIFAYVYPNIFLQALNYAGAFGAVILFGILPALMVWVGRYHKNLVAKRMVPGGKPILVIIMVFAIFVVLLQLLQELNLITIK